MYHGAGPYHHPTREKALFCTSAAPCKLTTVSAMDFAFPLVAVAQQQHLALAQQLGHGKREAQQEWNTHQAPASTSKRARTHAVEAAAATTGQQEALCVAHRGDCPGAPGAGSQAQPSYFPGTSIPLGGWILPCRCAVALACCAWPPVSPIPPQRLTQSCAHIFADRVACTLAAA